ncbi:hypothetical protein [Natronoarchaeum rubrum]|uniref:hypothetical protein n=1 Tax=Natronoarchaeum rubrum TaxID=755311 RepID=UPI002112005F|nr:hypothetical protein [Natronoarchaeum rubrum]
MGEGVAKTHLRSVVEERLQVLFPAFESGTPSSIYTQVRHRRHFTYEDIQQDGSTERIQWQADLTIRLSNLYSDADREVSRTVALEVKTGQYAQLERDQQKVMGIVNENDDYLILRANVRFDAESVAEIQYAQLEPAPSTKAGHRLSSYDL